jgi:hypothetical protein
VTWVLLVAVLAASGCAHREVSRSVLIDGCPPGSLARFVQSEINPELLHGEYVCVPVVPSKVRESK